MPELVPISHRELARKLRRAGFVEIRTRRAIPSLFGSQRPDRSHSRPSRRRAQRHTAQHHTRNANQHRGIQRPVTGRTRGEGRFSSTRLCVWPGRNPCRGEILTQRGKDAEVDTNLADQHEFPKPVRAGIVVENAIPKAQSSVRSDTVRICRPDGAGDLFGFGSTKMPRLWRWIVCRKRTNSSTLFVQPSTNFGLPPAGPQPQATQVPT